MKNNQRKITTALIEAFCLLLVQQNITIKNNNKNKITTTIAIKQ